MITIIKTTLERRRSNALTALIRIVVLICATAVSVQVSAQQGGSRGEAAADGSAEGLTESLSGVWDIEVMGSARTSNITVSLNRDHGGNGRRVKGSPWVGTIAHKGPDEESYKSGPLHALNVAEDGTVTIGYGQFAYCNCKREGMEVKPSKTPGVLEGRWSYEEEEGRAIWRKRPQSKIDSVSISRSHLDKDGAFASDGFRFGERAGRIVRRHPISCGYGMMRSNCDRIHVSVLGDGFAGGNNVWLDDEKLEVHGVGWICSDNSVAGDTWHQCGMNKTPGDQVIGLGVSAYLLDGIQPGMKELQINDQSVPLNLVISGYPIPKAIADFPDHGVVQDIGPLATQKAPLEKDNCNCDAITLGQVKTRIYVGMDSSILRRAGFGERPRPIYEDTVHYMIDKTGFPPERGNISVQKIGHRDLMCFYFTYPQELAAWVLEDEWDACKTVVEIEYPHSKKRGGSGVDSWQLFSQRGSMDLRSNTQNFICLHVREHTSIPPGKGSVTWSVDGQKCSTVPFSVK